MSRISENIFKKNLNEISGFDTIPKEWKTCLIQDIFEIGRGRVISQNEINEHPGNYPVYSSQSFNQGVMGTINTFDFEGEYLTWTTDGAYAGTVFHRIGKFSCTNVCGTLKANEKEVFTRFFLYHLGKISKQYVSYVGNPKLMNDIMANIVITVPPLPTQRKISYILSTVDSVIENTQTTIAKYKAIKQGMLHDLFTCGIDATTGKLRQRYEYAPELYKESMLGMVPKEWEVQKLEYLTEKIGSGVTPTGGSEIYKSSGVLFIRSQNVLVGNLSIEDAAFITDEIDKSMESSRVKPFDVLLNITGASIGRCSYFPAELKSANVNQHVCIIRFINTSKTLSVFASEFMNSNFGQSQISKSNAGGNRDGLNFQQIRSFYFPVIEFSELEKISKVIETLTQKLYAEQSYLHKLQMLKQGLMSDLLNGRKSVHIDTTADKDSDATRNNVIN